LTSTPPTSRHASPSTGAASSVSSPAARAADAGAAPTRTTVAQDIFVDAVVAPRATTVAGTASTTASQAVSTVSTNTSSASASLPSLPQRRLPPLREALVDPSVTPLSWSSVRVPDDVLAVLRGARRVLVVGHVPPDGDCVGSAAGLVAALRAAGKDAIAVVDDALPAACRAIDDAGRVQRAAQVDGAFDVVVLVDVAQQKRIGGAAAFLGGADHVVVIDHHEDVPSRSTFGVRDDQGLTSFIAPSADAAAILVGGIAAAFGDASVDAAQGMLSAAMYTDTLGFRAPGADRRTLQLFKGVVGDVDALDALERSLQPQLPASATALIDAAMASATTHRSSKGAVVVVDAAAWQALRAAAHAADPRMTDGDLRGVLCDRLDALRDARGSSMMLIEEPSGVRLSARSVDDGFAREVAEKLGGGGHGRAAGGFVTAPLADVQASLRRALDEVTLAHTARLRSGRLAPRAPAAAGPDRPGVGVNN
jgi:phosphoesterase RecJ-like protein